MGVAEATTDLEDGELEEGELEMDGEVGEAGAWVAREGTDPGDPDVGGSNPGGGGGWPYGQTRRGSGDGGQRYWEDGGGWEGGWEEDGEDLDGHGPPMIAAFTTPGSGSGGREGGIEGRGEDQGGKEDYGYGHGQRQWAPPPFAGNPAMPPPLTPPVSQYIGPLAGWAGGRASMPPPLRQGANGSGGAGGGGIDMMSPFNAQVLPFNSSGGGGGQRGNGPHTTGKDGRDGSKRQRTGHNSWQDASHPHSSQGGATPTGKPCLFWRQGTCKHGAECTYLHGDSLVQCTNFNTKMGCRFGDKCAFAHVPSDRPIPTDDGHGQSTGHGHGIANGHSYDDENGHNNGYDNGQVGINHGNNAAAAAAAAAVAGNPFSTHATNCGCPACVPYVPPKVIEP